MRRRDLLIGLTGVVLVAAVAIAVLYVKGSRGGECGGAACAGPLVTVIVPTEEIPANQLLDPLIEEGLFEAIPVPDDWLVEGAVTDVRDLHGLRTTTVILANEQITTTRLTARDSKPAPA
jgi:hypothetical protein